MSCGLSAWYAMPGTDLFSGVASAVKEGRIAVVQSLSGTGALRVAGEFIAKYNPGTTVYISDPSWGNHHTIFQRCGLQVTFLF